MNPIFKPKDKEDVLLDIAKGHYANRALLIGISEKHPELFDKFFNSLMKIPTFDIQAIIKIMARQSFLNVTLKNGIDEAKDIIKIFKNLNFDTTKFKLEQSRWAMTLKMVIDDTKLLHYYDKLADSYTRHKKKRKKQ